MAHPALNIACYFINRSALEGSPISNLKLQKMVYIANGIYLAKNHEPLIIERVEVWSYGPVIKPVYDCFKKFGSDDIQNTVECDLFYKIHPSEKELEVLNSTWDLCKNVTAIQLSNWTHRQESPWTQSLSENKSFISDSLLEEYFDQFLKKN